MTKPARLPPEIIPVLSTEDLGAITEALHEVMLEASRESRA